METENCANLKDIVKFKDLRDFKDLGTDCLYEVVSYDGPIDFKLRNSYIPRKQLGTNYILKIKRIIDYDNKLLDKIIGSYDSDSDSDSDVFYFLLLKKEKEKKKNRKNKRSY